MGIQEGPPLETIEIERLSSGLTTGLVLQISTDVSSKALAG